MKTSNDYYKLSELCLDTENPRLTRVYSQNEALEALIGLNADHFRMIMLSIKEHGLDPGDSFYIIEDSEDPEDDYIVVDGNRRLSALMVLHNPARLDGLDIGEKTKSRLRSAAEGFDRSSVNEYRCVLFENRADANEWIERRHAGALDGEGRITWGLVEIRRFTGDMLIEDALGLVGRNANFTEKEWIERRDLIESKRGSIISRVLDSGYGRQFLGITMVPVGEKERPTTTRNPKFVVDVIKQVIDDTLSGEINTRTLNKASDIETYLDALPSNLQPDPTSDTDGALLTEIDLNKKAKPEPEKKPTGKSKTKRIPKQRKTLAPRTVPFGIPGSTRGQTLLREASKIKVEDFKLGAAFLLRASVELAATDYAKTHNIPRKIRDQAGKERTLSLSELASKCKEHIQQNGVFSGSELQPFVKKIITKSSSTSIQSLNDFVHTRFATPTPDDLIAAWDSCVPIFIATYGEA